MREKEKYPIRLDNGNLVFLSREELQQASDTINAIHLNEDIEDMFSDILEESSLSFDGDIRKHLKTISAEAKNQIESCDTIWDEVYGCMGVAIRKFIKENKELFR